MPKTLYGYQIDFIPPILDSPINEERRFNFVPVELLPEWARESLLDYVHSRELNQPDIDRNVNKFDDELVYSWDFFAWWRWIHQERSINEKGIGYCNACGKLAKMNRVDDRWQCGKCGYYNRKIYTDAVKKDYTEVKPGIYVK